MLPQVETAYRSVARTAQRALSNAVVASSSWDGSYFSIPGHASGTDNAPPGWAWVGEQGPELMRMHGGEQILPNSVSRQAAKSYSEYSQYVALQSVQQRQHVLEAKSAGNTVGSTKKIEMHFHIEAGASPETVDAWQDYARRGELKSMVLEAMQDAEADAGRRVMG